MSIPVGGLLCIFAPTNLALKGSHKNAFGVSDDSFWIQYDWNIKDPPRKNLKASIAYSSYLDSSYLTLASHN